MCEWLLVEGILVTFIESVGRRGLLKREAPAHRLRLQLCLPPQSPGAFVVTEVLLRERSQGVEGFGILERDAHCDPFDRRRTDVGIVDDHAVGELSRSQRGLDVWWQAAAGIALRTIAIDAHREGRTLWNSNLVRGRQRIDQRRNRLADSTFSEQDRGTSHDQIGFVAQRTLDGPRADLFAALVRECAENAP